MVAVLSLLLLLLCLQSAKTFLFKEAFYQDHTFIQGGRKDGRENEPVGSCAMCDARSTGPRALEGKNR